jgi:drug/metabolite transporter (DMT)-like permease
VLDVMTRVLNQRPWTAYAAVILTTALWGSNPALTRLVLASIGPITLAWLRWLIVLVILTPVLWVERASIQAAFRHHWKILCVYALLACAPQNIITNLGLQWSSAVNLGLMNSTIPVQILIWSAILGRRRIQSLEILGVAVSMLGVLVILFQGAFERVLSLQFTPGDVAFFVSMLMWSIYTIYLDRRPAKLSAHALIGCISLIGVLQTLPLALFEVMFISTPTFTMTTVLVLAYIGAGPTLLAMLAYNHGVARIGAAKAGVLVHLMPVFASVFAVLVLNEPIRLFHAAGFALVVGGALLALFGPRQTRADLISSPASKT